MIRRATLPVAAMVSCLVAAIGNAHRATANPAVYEVGSDPAVGFNLILWFNDEQKMVFTGLLNALDGRGNKFLAVDVWQWGVSGSDGSTRGESSAASQNTGKLDAIILAP